MRRHLILALALVASAPSFATDLVIDGIELPAMPTKGGKPAEAKPKPESESAATPRRPAYSFDAEPGSAPTPPVQASIPSAPPSASEIARLKAPLELEVTPGSNEVVTISRGHLNRIVTPFENPKFKSTGEVTTETQANVIYVASDATSPVGIFIYDDAGGPAISLSLLPKVVPPREIRLKLAASHSNFGQPGSSNPLPTETAAPYMQAMTDLLVTIGTGKVPTGYTLNKPTQDDEVLYFCTLPGLQLRLAQVLDGRKWAVGVLQVKNTSGFPVEIRESDCLSEGVLAISSYPNAVIKPGHQGELYISRLKDFRPVERRARPRVFGE